MAGLQSSYLKKRICEDACTLPNFHTFDLHCDIENGTLTFLQKHITATWTKAYHFYVQIDGAVSEFRRHHALREEEVKLESSYTRVAYSSTVRTVQISVYSDISLLK